MKKKMLSAVLAAMMCLQLGGCQEASITATIAEEPETVEEANSDENLASENDSISVNIWQMTPEEFAELCVTPFSEAGFDVNPFTEEPQIVDFGNGEPGSRKAYDWKFSDDVYISVTSGTDGKIDVARVSIDRDSLTQEELGTKVSMTLLSVMDPDLCNELFEKLKLDDYSNEGEINVADGQNSRYVNQVASMSAGFSASPL